jgi:hypothetical protein
MESKNIYKISHILDGVVKYIYVFNGKNKTDSLDKLFLKKQNDPIFDGIFSPEEITDINENSIEVRFIPESIHLDDTIEIIKKKLLLHLMNDLNISFDELYFFIIQPEKFKAETIYHNLTQNEKLDLTKPRLTQFLLNLDEINVDDLPDKETYTYDDILQLNLEKSSFMATKPLGQKITSLKEDYYYTVNPFLVESYDTLEKNITTTNKIILMEQGEILNNTLYLCLAEEVLTFGATNNPSLLETNTIKTYFPYLYQKDIISLEQLNDRKQELLGETQDMLTPAFKKNIENVNLFYDIYETRKEEMKFNDVGIKSLIIVINQPSVFHLPLDNVFKLIHATQDVPLIKMNLSKRQEKIYRLYADKISTNGKKIPYLDKGVIFKWDKFMGKTQSVSVYIEHYEEDTSSITPIICEFNSNGSIMIKADFNTSLTPDMINDLFVKEVNPVIDLVKDYLAQDGYTMNNFVSLTNEYTEILNIEYSLNIHIEKEVKLKKIVGCLTSMFNIINDNLTNGIMMRFKRVSNYNEMESQEALILDMSEPHLGYSDNDIIKVLQANFQLTEKEAAEKYIEVKRAQEIMERGNKKLKKRSNPGFLTTIVKQPYNNIVIINVSGINNIGYLNLIYVYLDSLMRITQKKSSTRVSSEAIKTLCSGKKIQDEPRVSEIIAVEQPTEEKVFAEELVFKKDDFMDDIEKEEEEEEEMDEAEFLARFGYGEEEEEAASDNESGGASPSASEAGDDEEAEEDASEAGEEGASEAEEGEEEERLVSDITGLRLGNPSPFEKRIRKYDKNLFETKTGKTNFSSYATDCLMSRRRQPIVLTDDEKNKIDSEHPGSYSEAFKYGSDPSKQFWYICPRYWDLKNNVSLTEEEIKEKDLKDKIIPKNPPGKKVPPGKYIYEFNDYGGEHLKNNKYITHYPGFLKAPHEERGACLPCCFKTWDGSKQAGIRAQCTKDNTIVVPPGRKKKKEKEEIDEYILAPDKFPITQENRFGYLPIAVQKFLHTDNKKCQISDMNTNLRQDHECLLRHSVEINQNQSFIACIADIWFESYKKIHKEKVKPTIKRMKEIFIETLTIDNFITLQNGNLLKLFYPNTDSDDTNDIEKYAEVFSKNNSKIYQIADKTKPAQINALIKLARSYTNFIAYLKDETVEIDYEYLWDLICKPNPKLFPNGINMVIIELARKDITDSVELICPTNHYVSSFFDAKKSVMLILKIDNFYEPIYAYKTTSTSITITRTFNIMDNSLMPNIKFMLSLIKKSLNNKCPTLSSMPFVYNKVHKFKKNIPLEKLIHELQFLNYTTEKQVLNYDNKAIGVVAINNQDNSKGFIPCYPSSTIFGMDLVYMSDVYADTYERTKDFLEKLYAKSKRQLPERQIPCKPIMKIIEEGLIVGILTMTNQFVMLSEPTQDTFGEDLEIMQNTNYMKADEIISTEKGIDTERVNYIKKIQLETKFYNVFRNTARYLLGQYQHNDIRREIEEKVKSSHLYLKKLRSIETLLRDLMKDYVQFHQYEEADLLKLNTITNCYNNCENKAYCQANTEGGCSLLVPETNLINQKLNDTFYYGKLADEIVRYSRIKTFIFNPKSVLSFSQLKYNLRENEIILLQSLLTQEYFENLIVSKVNQYTKYNTYDTTQPIITQKYTNVESYDKVEENSSECNVEIKQHIVSKYWNAFFPANSKEYIYAVVPATCSFKAILTIIKDADVKQKDLTINELKEILLSEYIKIYDKYGSQILKILRAQGKKILAGQIEKKQISLSAMIMSEEYYATNLDIWLLAIYYNIPLIFISDTSLLENNKRLMIAHTPVASDNPSYYFLKPSATLPQLPPIYTVIVNGDQMKIDAESLRSIDIQTDLRNVVVGNNLLQFIEKFSLTEANTRKKIIRVVPAPTAVAVPAPTAAVAAPSVPAPTSEPLPALAATVAPAVAVVTAAVKKTVKNIMKKLKVKEPGQ